MQEGEPYSLVVSNANNWALVSYIKLYKLLLCVQFLSYYFFG
jgi:hypothetical protein